MFNIQIKIFNYLTIIKNDKKKKTIRNSIQVDSIPKLHSPLADALPAELRVPTRNCAN